MLMCLSLHFANPSAAEDGWLATVRRAKLGLVVGLLSLFVMVPLVDDGVGALLQYRYTARDGGIRVYELVNAYGFRDQREKPWLYNRGCGFACVNLVKDGTYAFQEYRTNDANGRYQLVFIADRPGSNCWKNGDAWNPPVELRFTSTTKLDQGLCLTYRLASEPAAAFAIRDHKETIDTGFGFSSLRQTNRQVVRLRDDKVVAETTYYTYDSRFFGDTFGTVKPWSEFLEQTLPPASGEWPPPD